jgi:hypothetical protein
VRLQGLRKEVIGQRKLVVLLTEIPPGILWHAPGFLGFSVKGAKLPTSLVPDMIGTFLELRIHGIQYMPVGIFLVFLPFFFFLGIHPPLSNLPCSTTPGPFPETLNPRINVVKALNILIVALVLLFLLAFQPDDAIHQVLNLSPDIENSLNPQSDCRQSHDTHGPGEDFIRAHFLFFFLTYPPEAVRRPSRCIFKAIATACFCGYPSWRSLEIFLEAASLLARPMA